MIGLLLNFSCKNRNDEKQVILVDTAHYQNSILTDTTKNIIIPRKSLSNRTNVVPYNGNVSRTHYYRRAPRRTTYYDNRQQVVYRRRGWSHAAKDAVIGGVGGAVVGGVVGHSVGGAAIGGVVGAGGGYIIGRKRDKREGR